MSIGNSNHGCSSSSFIKMCQLYEKIWKLRFTESKRQRLKQWKWCLKINIHQQRVYITCWDGWLSRYCDTFNLRWALAGWESRNMRNIWMEIDIDISVAEGWDSRNSLLREWRGNVASLSFNVLMPCWRHIIHWWFNNHQWIQQIPTTWITTTCQLLLLLLYYYCCYFWLSGYRRQK